MTKKVDAIGLFFSSSRKVWCFDKPVTEIRGAGYNWLEVSGHLICFRVPAPSKLLPMSYDQHALDRSLQRIWALDRQVIQS